MRFSVRHETLYSYESPVSLGQHRLRLSPRPGAGQLLQRALVVEPEPRAREEREDSHGNLMTVLDFGAPSRLLRVESRFEIKTAVPPPVEEAGLPALPWSRAPADLAGCLTLDRPPGPAVVDFAQALAAEQGQRPLRFLDALTETLYRRTDRRIRDTGYAQAPEETLLRAEGACRDLAVLFIACCRLVGLPARFASGYQAQAESVDGQRHLHAWPEVFLPGAGWRGFDPTHGQRVSDGHVVLCAAPGQGETMPVEGSYYGPPVAAELRCRVEIETSE